MAYPIQFKETAAVIFDDGNVYRVNVNTGATTNLGTTGLRNPVDIYAHLSGYYFLTSDAVYSYSFTNGALSPSTVSLLFSHSISRAQGMTFDPLLSQVIIAGGDETFFYNLNGTVANDVQDLEDTGEVFNSTGGITPEYPSTNTTIKKLYATSTTSTTTYNLTTILPYGSTSTQADLNNQYEVFSQTMSDSSNILPKKVPVYAISNKYKANTDVQKLYIFWTEKPGVTSPSVVSTLDHTTGIAGSSTFLTPQPKSFITGASFEQERVVYGCTDPTATNYNSLANFDDGSCDYTGGTGGPGGPTNDDDCTTLITLNTGVDFDGNRLHMVGGRDPLWMKDYYASAANAADSSLPEIEHHLQSPYMDMDDFEDEISDGLYTLHKKHFQPIGYYWGIYGPTSNEMLHQPWGFPALDLSNVQFRAGPGNPDPSIDRLKSIHDFSGESFNNGTIYDDFSESSRTGQGGNFSLVYNSIGFYNGTPQRITAPAVNDKKIFIKITDVDPTGATPDKYRMGWEDANGVEHYFEDINSGGPNTTTTVNSRNNPTRRKPCQTRWRANPLVNHPDPFDLTAGTHILPGAEPGTYNQTGIAGHELMFLYNACGFGDVAFEFYNDVIGTDLLTHTFGGWASNFSTVTPTSISSSHVSMNTTARGTEHGRPIAYPVFSSRNGHTVGDKWTIPVRLTFLGNPMLRRTGYKSSSEGLFVFTGCWDNQHYLISYPADSGGASSTYGWTSNTATMGGNDHPYFTLPKKRPGAINQRIKVPFGDFLGYACGQNQTDKVEFTTLTDSLKSLRDFQSYGLAPNQFSPLVDLYDPTLPLEHANPVRVGISGVIDGTPYGRPNPWYTTTGDVTWAAFGPMNTYDESSGAYQPSNSYGYFAGVNGASGVFDYPFSGGKGPYTNEQLNCPPGLKASICTGRPELYGVATNAVTGALAGNEVLSDFHGQPDALIPENWHIHCEFPYSMMIGHFSSFFVQGHQGPNFRTLDSDKVVVANQNIITQGNPVIDFTVGNTNNNTTTKMVRKANDFTRTFHVPAVNAKPKMKIVYSAFDNVMIFLDRSGTINLPSIDTVNRGTEVYHTCTLSDQKSMDGILIGSTCSMFGGTDYIVNPANMFKDASNRVINREYPSFSPASTANPYDANGNPTSWGAAMGDASDDYRSTVTLAHYLRGGFTTLALGDMTKSTRQRMLETDTGGRGPKMYWDGTHQQYDGNAAQIGNSYGNNRGHLDYMANGYRRGTALDWIWPKELNDVLQQAPNHASSQGLNPHKNFMATEIDEDGNYTCYVDGYYNSDGTPKFVYFTGAISGWHTGGNFKITARVTMSEEKYPAPSDFNIANSKSAGRTRYRNNQGAAFVLKGGVTYDCTNATGVITYMTPQGDFVDENQGGEPIYYSKAEAEARAKVLGCSGYHTHKYQGITGYMACRTHSEVSE